MRLKQPAERAWAVWAAVQEARQPFPVNALPAPALARLWHSGHFPPLPADAPLLLFTVGLPGVCCENSTHGATWFMRA